MFGFWGDRGVGKVHDRLMDGVRDFTECSGIGGK